MFAEGLAAEELAWGHVHFPKNLSGTTFIGPVRRILQAPVLFPAPFSDACSGYMQMNVRYTAETGAGVFRQPAKCLAEGFAYFLEPNFTIPNNRAKTICITVSVRRAAGLPICAIYPGENNGE